MSRKIINILPLLLLLGANVHAETLTLKSAISEFENSPRMDKSKSQKEEASWKKTGTMSVFLPDVYLKSYHIFKQKYVFADVTLGGSLVSVPSLVPATAYSVGFQMPLFDGFSNINKYSSATHSEKSAISDLDWNRFQGQREVIVSYFRALAANSLLDVAKQNLKALEDHLSDVLLFKKAGITTKFDVLRVEVQKSEATTEVLNATDNVQNAITRLGEILGVEKESREIEGTLPVLSKNILDSLDDSINDRSDINSLREKVIAIDEIGKADSKHLIPKVNFFGEYQKYNNRNDDLTGSDYFRNAYNIGVSLTWELFDGMKSISKDKISIEQKVQAEKSLKILEIKAKNDLSFWKRKFNYYSDVSQSRLNDIEKAEESVRLAKEGRRVGTRTNTDLLDAEAELYRARAGSVNAKLGAIEALINLELTTGKKLYNF